MSYTLKKTAKSQVEFIITVEPADYQKNLEAAAGRISERAAIKGFRPGKAPYNLVKQEVGELKILEEAASSIVEKSFFAAKDKEKLETIGLPQITIVKIAPGNEFVFKAVVTLFPKVKLGDLAKIKIIRETKEITDKEVINVLNDLKKMRPKETIKDGPATKDDKATVKMEMFIDKVPVEGGQAQNHQVYLCEPHYIPGFAEQIIGLKKDDTKEFALKFPQEHYQKHLAGKKVDFKIKVNSVCQLEYPEIDDSFAKSLGQENVEKLKDLLKKNLAEDVKNKAEQKAEIEIFDKLIELSEFDEIPDILLDAEKHKMFYELKHSLEQQGIEMEKYLKDLKKTEEEIYKDFAANAIKRVKAALLSRQIALDNDIKAEKEDLDKEIELIKQTYPGDKTIAENLKKLEVLDTLALTVQNKKAIAFLKDKILK